MGSMPAESECIGIRARGSSRGGKIVTIERGGMRYHTHDDVSCFPISDHGFLARLKSSKSGLGGEKKNPDAV
jgi:ribosomal protein L34